MTNTIVLGLSGSTDVYIADLEAGTIAKLADAETGALSEKRKQGGAFRGVDLAVAVGAPAVVASGRFEW